MASEADDREAEAEAAEQWGLINTPLGEKWSGRTRYAAAMYFYKRDEMNAETLEVYRICARLDNGGSARHADPAILVPETG